MIQIRNIHYTIGPRNLLNGVHWMIHPGRHMALIGPNGAGKTTLLNILHGDIRPDSGDIVMPRGTSIGYLPQEEVTLKEGTLLESVLQRQRELTRLEKQIREIQHQLEDDSDPSPALLDKLGRLEHHYASLGGYEIEYQAKQILSGLGFQEADFDRPISEFSGGWRMRSILSSLLIQDPDVLLLDEPTNHLDLPSLEWLEQYLLHFQGSVVIVSHDRFFIDRLATDIYELELGKLTHFTGKYHDYEQKKNEHRELLRKKWKAQQEERKRLQLFINRFRYKATKAAQVQSRIKELEKMESIELPNERQTWVFEIKVRKPSYKEVLKIRQMSFRYDADWVLDRVDLDIYRGEKLAMVGENGAGKTTLTRLIHGDFHPQQGQLSLGQHVEIGYHSQHQIDALDLNKSVIEEVTAFSGESASQRVRDILGIFQFRGDDIHKRIKVLSGGEKARVSLAKMLLSEANFLIMDEPTNHLDIISKEALEQALLLYNGTLLLISHDRYFLTKLVHKVIEVRDRSLKVYEGNYNDYLAKRISEENDAKSLREDHAGPSADEHQKPVSGGKRTKEQRRLEAEARDTFNRIKKPVEKQIRHYEAEIETLESRKRNLETTMADPSTYSQNGKIKELQQEHGAVVKSLNTLYSNWEAAQEKLEQLIREHEREDP